MSSKKPFQAEQFIATKWDSAEDKAKWANAMASWVLRGFPYNGWTKSLYHDLSNMYGHIAHYNQHGFYCEWFENIHRQREWLAYIDQGGAFGTCMGDPGSTWSDVEHAFRIWVRTSGLVARYQRLCAEDIEARERAQLARLQQKYQPEMAKKGA